jgi:putative hemolysin
MEVAQLLPHLIGLGLLLFLSGFFSGSETALCALNKVQIERLRSEKRKSAAAIVNFVDNPRRLFITILLGNTFINTAFTIISASLIYNLFSQGLSEPAQRPSGPVIVTATILITLLLLIFGEITPKTYAIKYAEGFSRITARPLWGFSVLIYPLRTVLRGITNLLIPLFGGSHIPREDRITAEDFKAIVNTHEEETLKADEREILGNILELREIEAKEIMVPRTEMVAMESSVTIHEVLDKAREVGLSRIPLYRKQIDNIFGVFHVKDLPLWRKTDIGNVTIEDFLVNRHTFRCTQSGPNLVHLPFFVLETKKIADLLSEFTHEKTKMAILLDEYGGISGLVTIEDIIEEVVGDIIDEHDTSLAHPEIIMHPDNSGVIEVFGRVSVRQINQQFNLKIDEGIADTIGGYVLGLFGRIPLVGESQTDKRGLRFEVAAMEGNLIGAVIMNLPQSADGVTIGQ